MHIEDLITNSCYLCRVSHIKKVVDPDTVHCSIDVGFNIDYSPPKGVRLYGVDGPELHSNNSLEVTAAKLVTNKLDLLLWKYLQDEDLWILSRSLDMYGRPLCEFISKKDNNFTNINELMISDGVLRSYDGKKARTPWTDDELNKIISKLK